MGLSRRSRRVEPPPDRVAATVLRLAVLLQAGITPGAAWRHAGAAGDADAAAVSAAVDAGGSASAAMKGRGGAWVEVAAAWSIATTVGAPLAESLRALAEALRDAHAAADDVRIALAEPAGTARLMLWLPLVGLVLGFALGFDSFAVLFGSPGGFACLAAGGGLLLGARAWTRTLVRQAQPADAMPGVEAELMAIALSGGTSLDRARDLVSAARGAAIDEATLSILALSRAAGVPAVELLRASAAHDRHSARTDGRMRAARLASTLLLPLGACTLPAFLMLGVAPLLLSVLSTTRLSL